MVICFSFNCINVHELFVQFCPINGVFFVTPMCLLSVIYISFILARYNTTDNLKCKRYNSKLNDNLVVSILCEKNLSAKCNG